MNTPELRQLKMAWIAAKEAGDTQAQVRILQEYPAYQDELIDFIAGYQATGGNEAVDQNASLLPLTRRALTSAFERVFESQNAFASLTELRKSRNLNKVATARGLRLSVDVWNKFENGAIELVSLSQRQLEKLAQFFQVSIDQFSNALNGSQPAVTLNRRQTREAASQAQQGPKKQSFAEAISRSTMSKEDQQFWQE
ncbi:helix-turn-helix domain-containing protein [Dictyobacter aurantiacus]|uniref:HTH cro/C1-type domain-containing protein n=1 Tax=Dictyobacter aurantiacus TaxID=1936993 RepID=A0A401ZDK8_9CHLR|nr:helix-turn-helix transcriptional regulator [Dictyobacter aurantiacus]GCE04935.1 hypothetical protein KDAU_22640 [Dictyobacter aurantiacus]